MVESLGLHVAEKLERDVEIVAGDPRDVAAGRPQPVDLRVQPGPQVVGQQDRDEGPDAGYRAPSHIRSKSSSAARRSGSVSTAMADLRSASAPSWSPASSRSRARLARAR